MPKLDELIRDLCPDEVESVPLWSVTIWDKKFSSVDRKKQPKIINYSYLLASDLFALQVDGGDVFLLSTGEQTGWTTKELAGENLREGEVVTIPWGKSRPVTDCIKYYKGKFVTADNRIMTSNDTKKLSNKYLYYWIMSQGRVIDTFYRGTGIKHPDMAKVLDMLIQIPPLEIQCEIVRVLDDYTENIVELQNQLTAEITARQKQYEFYRDKLLTFDVLRGGTINFYQRTLGELFDFRNGLSKGKEFFGKGTPFVRYTDVYNHRTLRKKDITALVECTEDEKERLKVSRGDVLFTRTSETAEDIGWSSVMLDDMDNCVFNGFTIKATPKTKELLPEYCAYCFSTADFRQYVTKHCAFTTRASLTGNTIAQYRMTIPPLDIQSRIVNVLDNFEKICSDLNIGLPAEIEARQKQYEYYRDKLLTFAETGNTILSRAEQSRALIKLLQYVFGYAVVTLEDIAENCDSMRKPVTSGKREAGEYPYYGASGIVDYVKDYIFDGDYLLVSEDGANLLARSTPIAFSISGKNWVNNHAHVLKFGCYETRRFVEFYLNSIDLAPYISGGAQPKLNQKNLNRIEIPLPSQERQKYIVDILDRFDAICNDLTSGLPAEIEARQKQYEYYRDKLLTFKEVAAT